MAATAFVHHGISICSGMQILCMHIGAHRHTLAAAAVVKSRSSDDKGSWGLTCLTFQLQVYKYAYKCTDRQG